MLWLLLRMVRLLWLRMGCREWALALLRMVIRMVMSRMVGRLLLLLLLLLLQVGRMVGRSPIRPTSTMAWVTTKQCGTTAVVFSLRDDRLIPIPAAITIVIASTSTIWLMLRIEMCCRRIVPARGQGGKRDTCIVLRRGGCGIAGRSI